MTADKLRATDEPTILDKIVRHKVTEIETAQNILPISKLQSQIASAPPIRDFLAALTKNQSISLIAEVKKASPSKGTIREDFDPVEIAKIYQASGAACISVLTDEKFFKGSLDYLRQIRKIADVPLLRKDFILDAYQIFEARAAGADAVLLIAECLSEQKLNELLASTNELGMTALVELYEGKNVEMVVASSAQLIGINNRDLRTFEVDLQHTVRLMEKIPRDRPIVAESGIANKNDVAMLQNAGVDAMLVGESLMRNDDIAKAIRELLK